MQAALTAYAVFLALMILAVVVLVIAIGISTVFDRFRSTMRKTPRDSTGDGSSRIRKAD